MQRGHGHVGSFGFCSNILASVLIILVVRFVLSALLAPQTEPGWSKAQALNHRAKPGSEVLQAPSRFRWGLKHHPWSSRVRRTRRDMSQQILTDTFHQQKEILILANMRGRRPSKQRTGQSLLSNTILVHFGKNNSREATWGVMRI